MIVSYPATPSQAAKNAKERRNQLQRERRATPEAKAKEVLANRTSRFRKAARAKGYGGDWKRLEDCDCEFCSLAIKFNVPVGTRMDRVVKAA